MSERIYYSTAAQQRAQREKLILALVITGLSISIGAMITLLFAPQPGEKTRQQISEQMSDAVAQGRQAAEAAGEQLREGAEKVRSNVNDRVQSLRD